MFKLTRMLSIGSALLLCSLIANAQAGLFTQARYEPNYYTGAVVSVSNSAEFIVYMESVFRTGNVVLFYGERRTPLDTTINQFLVNCKKRTFLTVSQLREDNCEIEWVKTRQVIRVAKEDSAMHHAIEFVCGTQ